MSILFAKLANLCVWVCAGLCVCGGGELLGEGWNGRRGWDLGCFVGGVNPLRHSRNKLVNSYVIHLINFLLHSFFKMFFPLIEHQTLSLPAPVNLTFLFFTLMSLTVWG